MTASAESLTSHIKNINRMLKELKDTIRFRKRKVRTEQKLNDHSTRRIWKLYIKVANLQRSKVEMIKTEQKLNEQLNKETSQDYSF